ncbi:Zinc-finger domain-containing protein [Plasmodiophora brassicae]|uniref:Zinc-finger domain-containing protein n=1 Tax=Plasmodiophora brassicae TaxID=37360 RepID=A0A0G4IGN2_PLABS|nr:hypothetical protein PBRA_000161 [Plasmodiophora brassicae]SPQ96725.1 unnamed protein product [Plasmodiophora brassicae]
MSSSSPPAQQQRLRFFTNPLALGQSPGIDHLFSQGMFVPGEDVSAEPWPVLSDNHLVFDAHQTSPVGSSCHQCKRKHRPAQLRFCTNTFSRRHTNEKRACRKKYCHACLDKFYPHGHDIHKQDASSSTTEGWSCPSCLKMCSCAACLKKSVRDRPIPVQTKFHLMMQQSHDIETVEQDGKVTFCTAFADGSDSMDTEDPVALGSLPVMDGLYDSYFNPEYDLDMK